MYVQFEDASEQFIVARFGGPQDVDAYPHQGEVDEADPRYLDFVVRVGENDRDSPVVPVAE
ncbi:hypothetical protein N5D52_27165 [Pseudomonas sp. GD03860]|uniref:hypothetical protein n=1 Tax=Pseudomonas TaxID=286 RepID=UPI0023633129|nr:MULTISPECIES: hypothetical protein [Pseudomonas]MDD2056626.1 hypothetical protein [Pseudomonas putida]MDH0640608.1 hypothetical protein [Pseudomonas sp. GD03860]